LATLLLASPGQPTVRILPMNSGSPRPIEPQTQSSVVRDYLQAWQAMGSALSQSRSDSLERYFVGTARDQLLDTIRQQRTLGIQTAYTEQSHDLRVLFYSPEGLSIQLLDTVELDVDVQDHGKSVGAQHLRTTYLAVLTPAESTWKIRVFQSAPSASRKVQTGVRHESELRKFKSESSKGALHDLGRDTNL
jgi:hypothetical protein